MTSHPFHYMAVLMSALGMLSFFFLIPLLEFHAFFLVFFYCVASMIFFQVYASICDNAKSEEVEKEWAKVQSKTPRNLRILQ